MLEDSLVYREFQDSLSYIVRTCLKTRNKNIHGRTGQIGSLKFWLCLYYYVIAIA